MAELAVPTLSAAESDAVLERARADVEKVRLAFEAWGVRSFLPPVNTRKRWTTSRLAVREDGTPIPVLHLLATAKFGPWDPAEKEPFWKDRNWQNETLENVGLCTIAVRGYRGKPTNLGIPSGTAEYFREYRKQNKDRVKEYQKRYREKQKELLKLAREMQEDGMKSESQAGLEEILQDLKGR